MRRVKLRTLDGRGGSQLVSFYKSDSNSLCNLAGLPGTRTEFAEVLGNRFGRNRLARLPRRPSQELGRQQVLNRHLQGLGVRDKELSSELEASIRLWSPLLPLPVVRHALRVPRSLWWQILSGEPAFDGGPPAVELRP